MNEVIAEALKAYMNYVKGYNDYCNNMMKIIHRTIKYNIEEVHPLNQVKTIEFFNGFLSGYEACKGDMKQLLPYTDKEPANFYL